MHIQDINSIRKPYKVNIENRFCVYKITSPSGLVYIGQTCKPKSRIMDHLNINTASNPYMKYELFRFGKYAMHITIIRDHLTRHESRQLEKNMIKSMPYNKTMNIVHSNKLTALKLRLCTNTENK